MFSIDMSKELDIKNKPAQTVTFLDVIVTEVANITQGVDPTTLTVDELTDKFAEIAAMRKKVFGK